MSTDHSSPRAPAVASASLPAEDKRLDRLLDYTKFHIGIYISIAGGLVALIGSASNASGDQFLSKFIGSPAALGIALILLGIAGLSGGIIASSCTQSRTFEEVWTGVLGPHKFRWFTGKTWACIEHLSFWVSMLALAYAVISAPGVLGWLLAG